MNQLDLFLPCAAGVEHCLAHEVRSLVADRMVPATRGPLANPLATLPGVTPAATPGSSPVRASARRPAPAGRLN